MISLKSRDSRPPLLQFLVSTSGKLRVSWPAETPQTVHTGQGTLYNTSSARSKPIPQQGGFPQPLHGNSPDRMTTVAQTTSCEHLVSRIFLLRPHPHIVAAGSSICICICITCRSLGTASTSAGFVSSGFPVDRRINMKSLD